MKREMDLVRSILLAVEEHPHGYAPDKIAIDEYTAEQIGYHVKIMIDGGLVNGVDNTGIHDESPTAIVSTLTWAGHEFLDAAREESRWLDAKRVISAAGGASIAVWTAVLTKLVTQNLDLQ